MSARRTVILGALAATLLAPASASATTFCVPAFSAACPDNGTNVAQPSLETAMTTNGSDGTADVIQLGAGTFTTTTIFTPTGADALSIIGRGTGSTFLTTTSAGNVPVMTLSSRGPTLLRDVAMVVGENAPDTGGGALNADAGTVLRDVLVDVRNPAGPAGTGSPGLSITGGISSMERVRIAPSGSGVLSTAISLGPGGVSALSADQLTIESTRGTAIDVQSGSAFTASRLVLLDLRSSGVIARPGSATLTNVLATTGLDVTPFAALSSDATAASITVDHGTVAGRVPGATSPPLQATVTSTGGATVTVRNSIVTGFANAGQRTSTGSGLARVVASRSHLPGTVGASGPGSTTATDLILTAPTFADAPGFDYSLAAGSSGIDAGTPGTQAPEVDLNGNPRVVDGNGDGTAVRDIGAYERAAPPPPPATDTSGDGTTGSGTGGTTGGGTTPPPAPDTTAPETIRRGGPGSRLRRGIATYRFRSNETGARFQCRLDKGRAKICTSPYVLRRLRAGKHVLRVRAIDAAGNVDRTPLVLRFKVPKRR